MKHRTFGTQADAELAIALWQGVHNGDRVSRASGFAEGVSIPSAPATVKYSELYTGGSPGSYAVPVTDEVEAAHGQEYRILRDSAGCWKSFNIDAETDQQPDASGHTSIAASTNPWSSSTNEPLPVVIFWGQSNALGNTTGGESAALSAAGIPNPLAAPETGQLTGTETPPNLTSILGRQWPIGASGATAPNMGPLPALIHHLMENGYPQIAALRVAYGATNLAVDWNPTSTSGLQLFSALVAGWTRVLELWGANAYPLLVASVQGESDAAVEAYAQAYGPGYVDFIDALVDAIPALTHEVPWYQVLLNDAWDPAAAGPVSRTYWSATRAGQEWVPTQRSQVTNVNQDDNDNVQVADEIHYDPAGYVQVGQAIGQAHTG